MPRKAFGPKTREPKQDRGPKSENEYLDVGVNYEEDGEKWRAGDTAKSLRFFVRATETYDAGLRIFPRSFDLAYNKARLEYDMAQQPKLLEHLPTPLVELLTTALDSHRVALDINQENTDILFNTAQVLTSVAEAITSGQRSSVEKQDYAPHALQEALELLQRCGDLQKTRYLQFQEDAVQGAAVAANPDSEELMSADSTASRAMEEEVWVSVEEPITKQTMIDTVIAQLGTLTSLCSLKSSLDNCLAWMDEYYRKTIQDKMNDYLQDVEGQHDAALANARFISAFADAAFRAGRIDIFNYERELTAAFNNAEIKLANDPQGLCDNANAEITFSKSLQAWLFNAPSAELPSAGKICWNHITRALESLAGASSLPNAVDLSRTYLRRGDCEMLRLCLGEAPLKYDLAIKSMPTLLKNAETYYRGAASIAKRNKENEEEQKDAEVKAAIAAALADDSYRLMALIETERDSVEAVVEEMHDESVLGTGSLHKIRNLVA